MRALMAVSTMTAPDVEPRQRLTKWLIGAASVVMLAGLLFGYDQGVIGGALDGIKQRLNIGTFAIEVITSWVTLGALVGALVAGGLADKIGRRQTIILAGVLFTVGEAATFYLFAFMCAVAFVFVWFLLPETRGRSLAQIQQMWEDRSHRSSHTPQTEEVA